MHPEYENRCFREMAEDLRIPFSFLLTSVRTFQIVVNGCLLAPGTEMRMGWWGGGVVGGGGTQRLSSVLWERRVQRGTYPTFTEYLVRDRYLASTGFFYNYFINFLKLILYITDDESERLNWEKGEE